MYAARRSGLKREMFGYIDGGYDLVLGRFREHLEGLGVEFRSGSPVARVWDEGDGVEVTLANGERSRYASVVLTVPATRVPALCPQLTAEERQRLGRVVYQGIICASFC